MVGDQIWLQRLHRCGRDNGFDCPALSSGILDLPAGHALDAPVFDDWTDLRNKRRQLDAAICTWVGTMPLQFPDFDMRYSNTRGVLRQHPVWNAMSHFFNHQTHHRGQVTCLLMQAGVDPGVTDLLALVGVDAPS